MFTFIRYYQTVFQSCCKTAFLPAINTNSCCSTFSPVFDDVGVSNFGYSNICVMVSYCCFNLQFPGVIWCKTFFIYLFTIRISSLVKCFLRSLAHFKNQVVFLLLSFKISGYVLDNDSLSDVGFQIFYFSLWLVFLFFWHCLSQSRVFNINKVQFINYF